MYTVIIQYIYDHKLWSPSVHWGSRGQAEQQRGEEVKVEAGSLWQAMWGFDQGQVKGKKEWHNKRKGHPKNVKVQICRPRLGQGKKEYM